MNIIYFYIYILTGRQLDQLKPPNKAQGKKAPSLALQIVLLTQEKKTVLVFEYLTLNSEQIIENRSVAHRSTWISYSAKFDSTETM